MTSACSAAVDELGQPGLVHRRGQLDVAVVERHDRCVVVGRDRTQPGGHRSRALSSRNLTPVVFSLSSHSSRWASRSCASRRALTICGWPLNWSQSVGSDVRRAGQVGRRRHQRRQRAERGRLADRCEDGLQDRRGEAHLLAGVAGVAAGAHQPGGGVPRVCGEALDRHALLAAAAVELEDEQQVGELGGEVGLPLAVAVGLVAGVVERCAAGHPAALRADRDDAAVTGVGQPGEQQPGERERAEVVGGHLQLEAVGGALVRRRHHAGVVDQQVRGAR